MARDIIVIGGSAGALEPLMKVVAKFPPDLPAAVLVVIHQPPWHRSRLAEVLSKAGPLKATLLEGEEKLEPRRIYVAQPDFHVLTEDSVVQLWRGPKENQHRPSVNVLFRAAATAYRERVIGVVLSGTLDDGAAGSWWIKKHGGVTVVQSPEDAEFPDMPRNALQYADIDFVVPAQQIGPLLEGLVNGKIRDQTGRPDLVKGPSIG